MDITGKLIKVLPIQTGQGKNGEWKKQDIILELEGTPAKKLCISLWNDKIISDQIEGSMLKVFFEIDSREYNDKWYTNLRGWKVEEISGFGLNVVPQEAPKDFPFDVPKEDKDFSAFEGDVPFDNEILPF